MPLARRASKKYRNFNMPISYKIGVEDKMKDAQNVCSIQDVLETRHGTSRWNSTAFTTTPDSLTFFKTNTNVNHLLVKDSTTLYRANSTGSHTSLKTGLTSGVKHRAVTFNNRHILAIGGDGLFSYDGTTFTQLGQEPPSAPTVASSGSGNTLTASDYQVATTFYDSTNGFETNIGTASSTVTVSSGEQIDVSGIDATAENANIDKVRIYLKDITNNSDWLFWAELNLGTLTDTIDDDPSSTSTPPTKNGAPSSGGGKYLTVFGQRLVYSGNATFPSDVFFSEPFLPDAFDATSTAKTINIAGNGPVTGLAVGYYSGDNQNPFLVAFKRSHIEIYTEIGGTAQQVVLSTDLGCIAPDSIQVINGIVFFMSSSGFHAIENGRIVKTKSKTNSIDDGHIDDIFSRSGFIYELDQDNSENFFSVYYPTLKQYMTFISEKTNTDIYKAYNFEFDIGGFRTYKFPVKFSDAILGDNGEGREVIFLSGEGGYIYTHSTEETKGTDVDADGNNVAVDAFAQLYWVVGNDLDASYNFGPFAINAVSQDTALTVRYFLNYTQNSYTDLSYDFSDTAEGFILDVSLLDVGILSDGRTIVRYNGEILKSAQSLLIGFYKSVQGESMGIIEGQLDVSKNGNPN